jgi:hypothetical protein
MADRPRSLSLLFLGRPHRRAGHRGLQVAVGVAQLLFGDRDPLAVLLQTIGGLAVSLAISVGIVTIIFAALERADFPADHVRRWNPGQLPDVGDEQPGPWKSAIEVALSVAFLLWWAGLFSLPIPTGGPDFRIEAAPVFAALYWPIFILAAARLVHNLIQWLRPRWRLVRSLTDGLTAIGGLALLVLIYRAGQWATIVSTGMPAHQAAELQTSLNLALKVAIVVTGVMWTFACLGALWKLYQARAHARPA